MAVPKATTSSAGAAGVIVTATPNPSKQEENDQNPNPILSFFTNFFKNFKLPHFPFLPSQKHKVLDEPATSDAVQSSYGVSYPRRELASGKLEADVVQVRGETQPLVVWQAYAIGGILVLRWAWVRWNERKSRKPPNDDTPPPSVD